LRLELKLKLKLKLKFRFRFRFRCKERGLLGNTQTSPLFYSPPLHIKNIDGPATVGLVPTRRNRFGVLPEAPPATDTLC